MLDNASLEDIATYSLRPTVSAAVLDEGAVLLDLESKYFYALNASGWAIAQLFESGATIDGVTRAALAWGASGSGEIERFISRMRHYRLLEATDGAADEGAVEWNAVWTEPSIEQQAEPLQTVMVSAFDPSIPLAE